MNETLLQALNWRYATKEFNSAKRITDADWATLEEALRLTPSSFGLQPWKFIVVKDAEIREQLLPHSWNQRQVVDCSHLLVMAAKTSLSEAEIDAYLQDTADTRAIPVETLSGFRDMMTGFITDSMSDSEQENWAKLQCYIALGNIMTAASMLKIDCCPMEGFVPKEYDRILGLTELGLTAALVCPFGYRSDDDKYAELAKVRYPREKLFLDI